ncbi:MAG: GNAT family N-acetyltransferase [Clostridia bacterium]|nr:GNAT family N-acetyltransferase [Clostridia bacterium]
MKLSFLSRLFGGNMPRFESERLKFRAIKRGDLEDIFEYSNNSQTSQYLLWSPHQNIFVTQEFIDIVLSKYKSGEYHDWAIVLKKSNKMIGTCGFTRIDEDNKTIEIGYVINPTYWGNGYATEAVNAILEFAFTELDINRVEARFMAGNDASLTVMKKVGMTFEGYLRDAAFSKGQYKTIGVSSILKREYLAMKK